MFKAELQTSNFTFEAYGKTAEYARHALTAGLVDHAEQYGIEPDWWRQWEGDIQTTRLELQAAYRDNELITSGLLSKQKGVNYDSNN
jgi:hypothetical protein